MKKIASTILILIVLASCNLQDDKIGIEKPEKNSIEHEIMNIPENKASVIVHDGCEYIIYNEDKDANSSYGFMAHKGNCSNLIHQCK